MKAGLTNKGFDASDVVITDDGELIVGLEAFVIEVSNETELNEAIENAVEGEINIIRTLNDIQATKIINIDKSMTIDLYNKVLTGIICVQNNTKVTIENGTINGHIESSSANSNFKNCSIIGKDYGEVGDIVLVGNNTTTFTNCDINVSDGDYGFGLRGNSTLNIIDSSISIATGVFLWAGYGTYEDTDNVIINIENSQITNNQWWGTERWCCTYSWNTWHDEIEVSIKDSNFFGKVGGIIDSYIPTGETKYINEDGSVSVK